MCNLRELSTAGLRLSRGLRCVSGDQLIEHPALDQTYRDLIVRIGPALLA
jgi:hypothetical protein